MRVLTIHNYPGNYATGGEGNVFEAEADLLRSHNHDVYQYKCTNSEILQESLFKRIKAFLEAPWSQYGYRVIREEIDKTSPDIMHVHNFFFILSPSIFRAARDAGIPVVATLHNYRLISPCSQLLRNGKVCEVCLNKNPWRILVHRCYHHSLIGNILRYRIYYSGKKKYGWLNDIDSFISLTEFGKSKYIEGGLPKDRIYVKPNFIYDPMQKKEPFDSGYGAVFVGRVSTEKGIKTLLEAWRGVDYPLTIVGDGPQMAEVKEMASGNVEFVGMKTHTEAMQYIKNAAFIIFPSEWYEGFPLTILESMASGKTILASDLGPRSEMIKHKENGLLFKIGDSDDLHGKAKWLINHPDACVEMGKAARNEYLEKYSAKKGYEMLIEIYKKTIERYHFSKSLGRR